jgi:hypothetical protein
MATYLGEGDTKVETSSWTWAELSRRIGRPRVRRKSLALSSSS